MNREAYHAWKANTPYPTDWRAPVTVAPRKTMRRTLSALAGRAWHRVTGY
ncbi:MAG: hypothetical protein ACRDYV_09600 [Acidimicrobiia bacterium]